MPALSPSINLPCPSWSSSLSPFSGMPGWSPSCITYVPLLSARLASGLPRAEAVLSWVLMDHIGSLLKPFGTEDFEFKYLFCHIVAVILGSLFSLSKPQPPSLAHSGFGRIKGKCPAWYTVALNNGELRTPSGARE